MNINFIEQQLKQRMEQHNHNQWGRVQNDSRDRVTRLIYNTKTWEDLTNNLSGFDADTRDYAIMRWTNFLYAKATEYLFCQHDIVRPEKNKYHKTIDFYINGIGYDLKSSVCPKSFGARCNDCDKQELVTWFYENQSRQGRFHLSNRLFIVLKHWRQRAELNLASIAINDFLDNYQKEKYYNGSNQCYSGVLFIGFNKP